MYPTIAMNVTEYKVKTNLNIMRYFCVVFKNWLVIVWERVVVYVTCGGGGAVSSCHSTPERVKGHVCGVDSPAFDVGSSSRAQETMLASQSFTRWAICTHRLSVTAKCRACDNIVASLASSFPFQDRDDVWGSASQHQYQGASMGPKHVRRPSQSLLHSHGPEEHPSN